MAHLVSSLDLAGDLCGPLMFLNTTSKLKQGVGATEICMGRLDMRLRSPIRLQSWIDYKNPPPPPPVKNVTIVPPVAAVVEILPASPVYNVSFPSPPEATEHLSPCLDAPTPTPLPRGIESLIPIPIGYRTIVENKSCEWKMVFGLIWSY